MIVFPVLIPGQNFLFPEKGKGNYKMPRKGNLRLVFPGIMGNGNSFSPLIYTLCTVDWLRRCQSQKRKVVCVCVWVCVWVGRWGERTVFTNFFFTLILSVKTTLWARVRIAMSQSIVLLRYFLWRTIVLTFIIVSTGPWSSIYNSHKSSFPAQYWIYFWSWNKYLDHNIFCASVVAQIVITQADWKSPETKLKLICNWNKNCFHLMLRWVRLG